MNRMNLSPNRIAFLKLVKEYHYVEEQRSMMLGDHTLFGDIQRKGENGHTYRLYKAGYLQIKVINHRSTTYVLSVKGQEAAGLPLPEGFVPSWERRAQRDKERKELKAQERSHLSLKMEARLDVVRLASAFVSNNATRQELEEAVKKYRSLYEQQAA